MNSWMKRRINRSRARCHKVLPERKEKARHQQSAEKANRQSVTIHRRGAHTANDK
jgi:hypothetical protein